MPAATPPLDGPHLRLLRLRSGVGQRALARALGRRPSWVGLVENSVHVTPMVVAAYIDGVHGVVRAREALTIDDLG